MNTARPMNAESRLQKQIVSWWNLAASGYKLDPRLLIHVPNGGKRGKIEAAILKGMGVRAGFPDLLLLVPHGDKHGLLLEVKTATGRLSPEQKTYLPLLEAQGYAVCVVWGFDEALRAISNYLKTGHPLIKTLPLPNA